jgi:hypothetical protein
MIDRSSVTVLLISLVLTACGGSDRSSRASTERDSLGIKIVENNPYLAEDGIGWSVDPRPVLILGSEESAEAALLNPIGPIRLGDGRILFSHLAGPELRFYDSRGRLLTMAGSRGEGPGEFRAISAPWVFQGDSIFVWDGALRRGSVFDLSGQFIRTVTFAREQGPLRVVGAFADGSLLIEHNSDSSGDLPYSTSELGTFSLSGVELANFGKVPIAACGSPTNCTIPWFGPVATRCADAGHLYFGYPNRYEIRIFTKTGNLERIIRSDRESIPITASALDAYKTYILEQDADRRPEDLERSFAGQAIPETMPAFRRFVVDHSGHLWVREFGDVEPIFHAFFEIPFPFSEDPTPWSVFSEDGFLLGMVYLPSRLTVSDIGDDYVLGIFTDELGVQTVRMYDLER